MTEPLTIAAKVRRIVAEHLDCDPHQLTDTCRFDVLGASDVAMIHVVMAVEDLVDAEATDDDAEQVKTFGDLCRLAERLASEEAVA